MVLLDHILHACHTSFGCQLKTSKFDASSGKTTEWMNCGILAKVGVENISGYTYSKVDDNENIYVTITDKKREESKPVLFIN